MKNHEKSIFPLKPGPVVHRLQRFGRVHGFVVGAHAEFSPDLANLVRRMAEKGAQTRFRDLGFSSATEAYSTVYQQVLLVLGIEATRGMARLRIARLGTALAGNISSKNKAKRQQANREAVRPLRVSLRFL